jgi:hypothetical protein
MEGIHLPKLFPCPSNGIRPWHDFEPSFFSNSPNEICHQR